MSRATPPSKFAASSADPELSYFHALYIALWKPLYFGLGFVHAAAGCWLIKHFSDNPLGYAYALAFMIAAPVVYLELLVLERAAGWSDGPFIVVDKLFWVGTIGYSVALALVLFLLVQESNSRTLQRQSEIDSQRERESRGQLERQINQDLRGVDIEALRAAQQRRSK